MRERSSRPRKPVVYEVSDGIDSEGVDDGGLPATQDIDGNDSDDDFEISPVITKKRKTASGSAGSASRSSSLNSSAGQSNIGGNRKSETTTKKSAKPTPKKKKKKLEVPFEAASIMDDEDAALQAVIELSKRESTAVEARETGDLPPVTDGPRTSSADDPVADDVPVSDPPSLAGTVDTSMTATVDSAVATQLPDTTSAATDTTPCAPTEPTPLDHQETNSVSRPRRARKAPPKYVDEANGGSDDDSDEDFRPESESDSEVDFDAELSPPVAKRRTASKATSKQPTAKTATTAKPKNAKKSGGSTKVTATEAVHHKAARRSAPAKAAMANMAVAKATVPAKSVRATMTPVRTSNAPVLGAKAKPRIPSTQPKVGKPVSIPTGSSPGLRRVGLSKRARLPSLHVPTQHSR